MLEDNGLQRLNQYGSIFDFIRKDNDIANIKSVKSDETLPVFYLDDHVMHVKMTVGKDDETSSPRPALYDHRDRLLSFIDVDQETNSISFNPSYYHDQHSTRVVSVLSY
jgi:hypothetical protein